jgi:hypothetical protein
MNEPNGLINKGGRTWANPTEYALSACATYRAIHTADPSATVVVGSLDVTDWRNWLRSSMRAGLAQCFDVLSAHPYSGMAVLDEIRDLASQEGRPGITVWVTEFGESTCGNQSLGCVSEDEQATILVDSLLELASLYPWVPVAVIYESRDEPYVGGGPAERSFGLFLAASGNTDPVPKPAVTAIRELYKGI